MSQVSKKCISFQKVSVFSKMAFLQYSDFDRKKICTSKPITGACTIVSKNQ